jgi:ABC-type uncharacterized transport system permease subunit
MTTEAEVVAHSAEGKQEALSGINRWKALHLSFSVPGRLMGLLGAVVPSGT